MTRIPHLRIVVGVTAFVLLGFGAVSGYVLGWTADDVTKGNVIGTWINFAMLAVGFWLGSSSAGKAKPETPQEVTVTNSSADPISVEQQP